MLDGETTSSPYAPYASRAGSRVSQHWVDRYEREAGKMWELFYRRNADRFFKDRHYLETEWPELRADHASSSSGDGGGGAADRARETSIARTSEHNDDYNDEDDDEDAGAASLEVGALLSGVEEEQRLLEAGCGVGNTLFPLLQSNPRLRVYAFDFSPAAVEIVRRHPLTASGRVIAAVGDLTSGELPAELAECTGRCHAATLMFVLSAISPERMGPAIDATASALTTGGLLLIRDYANGDAAQTRLQQSSLPKQLDAAGRFFVRQDGTRAYYFELAELAALVEARGFTTVRCEISHRVTTNRAKGLSVERRYITATFRRLAPSVAPHAIPPCAPWPSMQMMPTTPAEVAEATNESTCAAAPSDSNTGPLSGSSHLSSSAHATAEVALGQPLSQPLGQPLSQPLGQSLSQPRGRESTAPGGAAEPCPWRRVADADDSQWAECKRRLGAMLAAHTAELPAGDVFACADAQLRLITQLLRQPPLQPELGGRALPPQTPGATKLGALLEALVEPGARQQMLTDLLLDGWDAAPGDWRAELARAQRRQQGQSSSGHSQQ